MGGKCCFERKDVSANGNQNEGAPSAKPDCKCVHAGNAGEGHLKSVGYQSKGVDAEMFDKAFEDNNLQAFVGLLSSQQKIRAFDERMHPWAEDPQTVGALAGIQLAILASVAERENPRVKDEIREAGAIAPLVDFIRSGQPDRIQTAVVAFSFLISDSPGNVIAAYDHGLLPLLMQYLDSPIAGMRAATATTLRDICVAKKEYCKEFVELGGIKGFVEQLASPKDDVLNHADVLLEAVLNLQDIIENLDDQRVIVIDEYALKAIEAGAEEKLTKLLEFDDPELRNSAQQVLNCLRRCLLRLTPIGLLTNSNCTTGCWRHDRATCSPPPDTGA